MSKEIELVEELNAAFENKDFAVFEGLLHDQYTFKGPLMSFNSKAECVEFLKKCPFNGTHQNSLFAQNGNTVIQIFDWVVTEPFQETIRMSKVITFENGQIKFEELIYDSAKFPKEVLEGMGN